jgi:hypothetical protein
MCRNQINFSKLVSSFGIPLKVFVVLLTAVLASGCGKDEADTPKAPPVDSTAIRDSLAKLEENNFKLTYHYFPEHGRTSYSGLAQHFSNDELQIILAINRLDKKNFGRRDSVVIPDTFMNDFLRYSPFPARLQLADPVKKLILFSYRIQAYAAYEHGLLVKWGPTSMGKRSAPTPTGLFHTTWKAKKTKSTINPEWILPWAFNLDNFEGVSMHEYDLPGYPASHACARLWSDDAQWMYYWAEQWIVTDDEEDIVAYGTPVIIYGEYEFGQKPPWHFLPQSPDTTTETVEAAGGIVYNYLETIADRQESRDSIVAERARIKEEKLKQQKLAAEEDKKPASNKKKKRG